MSCLMGYFFSFFFIQSPKIWAICLKAIRKGSQLHKCLRVGWTCLKTFLAMLGKLLEIFGSCTEMSPRDISENLE